jgi:hypothetical protein
MRVQINQTSIMCDCCGQDIVNPITTFAPDYLNFKDTDLCSSCTIKVLYMLLVDKIITEEKLAEVITDLQNRYDRFRPNIALL